LRAAATVALPGVQACLLDMMGNTVNNAEVTVNVYSESLNLTGNVNVLVSGCTTLSGITLNAPEAGNHIIIVSSTFGNNTISITMETGPAVGMRYTGPEVYNNVAFTTHPRLDITDGAGNLLAGRSAEFEGQLVTVTQFDPPSVTGGMLILILSC
jgi:hypothetical protein